jgi:hypothetical protein
MSTNCRLTNMTPSARTRSSSSCLSICHLHLEIDPFQQPTTPAVTENDEQPGGTGL